MKLYSESALRFVRVLASVCSLCYMFRKLVCCFLNQDRNDCTGKFEYESGTLCSPLSLQCLCLPQADLAQRELTNVITEVQQDPSKLVSLTKDVPQPIKEICETAVSAHSPEAIKKGAVIHDFCLGITYGEGLYEEDRHNRTEYHR